MAGGSGSWPVIPQASCRSVWPAVVVGREFEPGAELSHVASDVWVLEHLPNTMFREPSADACDFYHR
jgi:hypothetical protein